MSRNKTITFTTMRSIEERLMIMRHAMPRGWSFNPKTRVKPLHHDSRRPKHSKPWESFEG